MHVDATIMIFSGRGQALPIFNRGQDNRVGGDGAFYAIHAKRQAEASG
jgi:hypothetical protein